MVPANVLRRVFQLDFKSSCGTAFAMDEGNRQYLITAKHVVEGIAAKDTISLFANGDWGKAEAVVVGFAPDPIDIAVLALNQRVSIADPLPADLDRIILAQDVFFLGFPYGLRMDLPGEATFPLPVVKKGIVSAFLHSGHRMTHLYLDGHNNPGFSGGPVVFCDPPQLGPQLPKYRVAGVISGFAAMREPVYRDGKPTDDLTYKYNTGIINVAPINFATDIIKANPIGFALDP